MNILHILYGLDMGGIQTMLIQIANEEKRLGHEISIMVINNMIDQDLIKKVSNNIKLYKINRKPKSKNPIDLLRINYLIYKINPDVIHLHQDSIINLILSHKFKKRCCITMHTMPNISNSRFLNKIKNIFAISKIVQKALLNDLGLKADLVYNGIDTKLIKNKKEFNIKETFKIVQIGRLLCSTKGQNILIEALSNIINKKGITNLHLDIIGDGPSKEEINKIITKHQLSNYVSLMGQKSPEFIYAKLCTYDLLVQPSFIEGFGLTIIEAMAAKVPVLVSSLPAPMEIINNGELGYYFQTGNIKDCEKAILEIISIAYDKEKINMAYEKVSNFFSIEQTAENYIREYNKIKTT